MAPTVTAPPTRRRPRLPRWLVEVATLAILTIALSPLAFGTFGGDQMQTTLAVGGLVVALLAVAGIAAVRQPRHGWPLALETWLASLLASFVQVTWFPAGHRSRSPWSLSRRWSPSSRSLRASPSWGSGWGRARRA